MLQRALLRLAGLLTLAALVFGSACSKQQLSDLAQQAQQSVAKGREQLQQSVESAAGAAREGLQLSGTATLQIDEPIVTQACYASYYDAGGGRPRVLQFRSYRDAEHESFPSLLLHATTTAASPSELAGQTLTGQLYVQEEMNGPVWHTVPGTHVEVSMTAGDGNTLRAVIVSGTLHNAHTDADHSVTGQIEAVWP